MSETSSPQPPQQERDPATQGTRAPVGDHPATSGNFFSRAVLFPDIYVWYILLASLDLILTWVILHLGGYERNTIADWMIERFDLLGAEALKFGLTIFVIIIIEIIGRVRRHVARWVAILAIVVSGAVVCYQIYLIFRLIFHEEAEWVWHTA